MLLLAAFARSYGRMHFLWQIILPMSGNIERRGRQQQPEQTKEHSQRKQFWIRAAISGVGLAAFAGSIADMLHIKTYESHLYSDAKAATEVQGITQPDRETLTLANDVVFLASNHPALKGTFKEGLVQQANRTLAQDAKYSSAINRYIDSHMDWLSIQKYDTRVALDGVMFALGGAVVLGIFRRRKIRDTL